MSKLRVGLILALVGSMVLGVLAGLVFLSLFKSQVTPQNLSLLTKAVSPVTYVMTGLGLGLVIAAWSLLVASLAPQFRAKKSG